MWIFILISVVLAFLLFKRDEREEYSFLGKGLKLLGLGDPWGIPSLNCFLKNQTGNPTSKVTTPYLGMDGSFTGIDVITGIELTNLEDQGPISIVSGTEISFDFNAVYGQVNKIPFLPAMGNLYFIRKGLQLAPSERKGISATIYGFNLSPDIKQKIVSQDWNYYFFNQSFEWDRYGGTSDGPNCQTIDQTGNIGCGDVC